MNLEETTYERFYPPPRKSVPVNWVFHAARFERPMLFRDRYCPMVPLLVTGLGGEERDFYVQYHSMRLRGLQFELMWQSG